MEKQVRIYNLDINYDIVHRDIKFPRLEFRTGKLCLILPKDYTEYDNLIEKHHDWIYNKLTFVNDTVKKSTDKILQIERTDDELKELIYKYAKEISKKNKIHPKKIYFRKMKSKWGSCSSKKNLMFNTQMKYLPDDLIKYVILHEMTHIIERKHNRRFWKIISKSFSDYEKKEKDLFLHWFLTQKISEENISASSLLNSLETNGNGNKSCYKSNVQSCNDGGKI